MGPTLRARFVSITHFSRPASDLLTGDPEAAGEVSSNTARGLASTSQAILEESTRCAHSNRSAGLVESVECFLERADTVSLIDRELLAGDVEQSRAAPRTATSMVV